MWSLKHQPASLAEFHGSPKTVEFLADWDFKPLIIHGGPGVGKTLLTHLTAKEHNLELLAVNRDNIEEAFHAASTASLFGGRKLLVVEDADEFRKTSQVAD
jgi:replication-associated recombination protein RarA